MADIIKKLFGSEENASELQQLHEELRIAIDNLRKLEQDWHEKVRIIQQFLRDWNGKLDLNKLNERIRILKKIEESQRRGFGVFGQSILHLEHIMQNNEVPESIRIAVKEIFMREEETWKSLKSNIQWQLYFIEENMNKDIGVVRFYIKNFIKHLKEEGVLLGIEKREMTEVIAIEKSIELKFQGGMMRRLKYKKRLERLYSLGFPKYHYEELADFLIWEWPKTEKIIKASGRYTKYVFSRGILKFSRFISRDNLLDIGEATGKLASAYGEDETDKIVSKLTDPYFVMRNDIFLELADIIIAARENRDYIIESIGYLREMMTKENVIKIGKNLIRIADACGENAEPVLSKGIVSFKFLINQDNLLEVGLCLAEMVQNG